MNIKGQLKDVCVAYSKDNYVLKSLNLDIHEGELLSLLGPSGCGKSTTLRTIAGFNHVAKGQFILDGQDYTDLAIHDRDFGIVFQSYALFPHLSVYDNVAFGLKTRKVSKAEIEEKVNRMIGICNLSGFEKRFPNQLSGGQRQRVALARALVIEPKLLLLDEPLSNLDAQLRVQMRNEIRRIQQELNITTVFVTHDQEECFAISDRVAIMKDGMIEQIDHPEAIYQNPKTEYVARFVGFDNFVEGHLMKDLGYDDIDETKLVCIRPEDVSISESGLEGNVVAIEYLGNGYRISCETSVGLIHVMHGVKEPLESKVYLKFKQDKLRFV